MIQLLVGASAGSLIWTSAQAQYSVPPPGSKYGSYMVGAPGATGQDGVNGGQGGIGGTPAYVANDYTDGASYDETALGVVSQGGDGGVGAGASSSSGNGGAGGAAGGVTARFVGGWVTGTSVSPTILVTSTGGNGASPGAMDQELGTPGGPGAGGAGGNVDFEDYVAAGTQISATQGWNGNTPGATAVLLQSTGGNGGAPSSGAQSIGSADGAVGGNGGAAGTITATLGATTISSQGSGLVAISQGGAGSTGTQGTGGLGKGAGGNGGVGGQGGTVTLDLQDGVAITAVGAPKAAAGAQIPIDQNGSFARASSLVAGVLLQSLGGVGGDGGAASGAAAVAGKGGAAGGAGSVTLNPANGSIQVSTNGYSAPGIVLQSIGGPGGNGAIAGAPFYSHSGNGATGGDGASVTAEFADKIGGNGFIATTGNDSSAVIAQSIGGGGGVGGSAQTGSAGVTFTIGGNGESGGNGSNVQLFNGQAANGEIGYVVRTEGNNSSALVAQSIGGGGGTGGSVGASVVGPLSYVVGGVGGGGGSAGIPGASGPMWVDAENNGIVFTGGEHSKGLVAQAVGGGGGDGGSAASMTSSTGLDINVSLGGSGGGGGDAGNVRSTNSQQILTSGSDAWGVLAQSVGGGGGNGGSSKAESWTLATDGPVPNLSLEVTVGGNGKTGGTGGDATGVNNGLIMTGGAGAHGLLVQSIGGGGGNGGDSSALNEAVGTGDSLNVTVNVGGTGGTGGPGGNVTANNAPGELIWTLGDSARGIFAQSVSGGGGSGGTAKTDSDYLKKVGASGQTYNITLGGTGGDGGNSSTVTVSNDGNILTLGNTADAIFAQSVGGGGGLGGHASTEGSGGQNTATLNVSGSSGTPSNGGAVNVTNNGNIYTRGGNSSGIYAQSVGGGGGKAGTATKGGDAQPTLSLKDFLADSSMAGYTTTYADGTTAWKSGDWTDLSMANLVNLAQFYRQALARNPAPANTEPDTQSGTDNLVLGLGDKDPSGHTPNGSGGAVTVTNNAQIQTNGPAAAGIWAQSVGGGGGEVGATHVAATTSGALTRHDTKASVGGTGFNQGDGGSVNVNKAGQITTAGDASYGVLAQSLGGGGGHATITDSVNASTSGTLDITIGGGGNTHGNGGAVNVQAVNGGNSYISTTGNDAIGIFAQSIGGGGGVMAVLHTTASADGNTQGSTMGAGDSRTAGLTTNLYIGSTYVGPVGPNDPPSDLPQCEGYLVASCGKGGSVTVAADNISTSGRNAHGIVAQNIGGSGGTLLGATPTGGTPFVNTATTWGAGQSVVVTVNNSISTTGAGAYGVLAQSIGGGGLLAGDLSATNLLTSAMAFPAWQGNGDLTPKFLMGDGGAINVSVAPNAFIHTTGANALGIFAQSVGGAGGLVQTTGGTYMGTMGGSGKAGAVNVAVAQSAIVQADGSGSSAIFTNSEGQSGSSSNLYVDNSGAIIGNPSAPAIVLSGNNNAGGNGSVDNYGNLINPGGIAVQARGTIDASGASAFAAVNNMSGGSIQGDLQLGSAGWLNNAGQWSIGSSSTVGTVNNQAGGTLDLGATMSATQATSTLVGTLNSAGNIRTVADFTAQSSSNLQVNGPANLTAGQIVVGVASNGGLQPSPVQVIATSGTLSVGGAVTAVDAMNSSVTYAIDFQNDPVDGGMLTVTPGTQFAAVGAQRGYSRNQQSLAAHLDAGFTKNMSPEMARVYGRLSNLDDAHVQGSMDMLGNEAVQSVGVARLAASQDFVERMNSCPQFDGGSGLQLREQDCLWSRAVGIDASRDASSNRVGYDTHSSKFQIGGQKGVGNDWFVGGSLGYDSASLSAPLTSVSGTGWTAALIAKKQMGDWIFSGAMDAGTGSYDSQRQVLLGDAPEVATASFDATHVGVHGRAARQIPMEGWYLKPYVDVHAVHLRTGAYGETGANGLNLQVGAASGTAYTVSPMLEAGTMFDVGSGMQMRGYVSGGLALSHQNAWTANASLQGSVPEAGTFQTTSELPSERFKINLGADLVANKNLDVRVEYTGEFASGFRSNGAMVKAAYAF